MKPLRINMITMVVFCLMTQLPASEPTEVLTLNTTSLTVSYESANPNIVVLNPTPLGGYMGLREKIKYPEIAKMAGFEPCVVVRAYIDADGQVRECRMIEGPENFGFDETIIKAIKNTGWTPAIYDGKAAPSNLDITFQFKLYD
ncbi:MAG: energy transducer TonB [Candidatus Marinimicrobia bacterium]|nr:energy transducer TonB [Candidatus Neomarinimicrobiota bacterium]